MASPEAPKPLSKPQLALSYALAVILPIAGLFVGLAFLARDDPKNGRALIVISIAATILWVAILTNV